MTAARIAHLRAILSKLGADTATVDEMIEMRAAIPLLLDVADALAQDDPRFMTNATAKALNRFARGGT